MNLSWREFQQYLHSPPASGVLQLRLYFLENSESYRPAFSWGGPKIALSAGQNHWRRYWTFWIRFLSEYFCEYVCIWCNQLQRRMILPRRKTTAERSAHNTHHHYAVWRHSDRPMSIVRSGSSVCWACSMFAPDSEDEYEAVTVRVCLRAKHTHKKRNELRRTCLQDSYSSEPL